MAMTAQEINQLPIEDLALKVLAELEQCGPNERHLRNFTFKVLTPLVETPAY